MRNYIFLLTTFLLGSRITWAQNPQNELTLPSGVKTVWDLNKAYRKKTMTRDMICINGLWQWQPAQANETLAETQTNVSTSLQPVQAVVQLPPTEHWGWFKVPGSWPGITDYMQKDDQRIYTHPQWQDVRLSNIKKTWYQREIEIPKEWENNRIMLRANYVNSRASVYLDGKHVGDILFPSGELDISEACKSGAKHLLTIEVTALPLADVIAIFGDTNAPRSGQASVNRRGLCGDLFLVYQPSGAHISDVRMETSVRKNKISIHAAFENIKPDVRYNLQLTIKDKDNATCFSAQYDFSKNDLTAGMMTFMTQLTDTMPWQPKFWDINTPENMYEAFVSLVETEAGNKRTPAQIVDEYLPVRFGFREFWIDGRDLYLNGSRIWLSCVPIDNAQVGAALANYEAAKESMLRLQSFGVNFVYTHNYDCNPGSYISFAEILRAADDVGMLVSFAQPHFGHYDWESSEAETQNGYARLAKFLVGEAQNHPSVIFYSMSHNATGYSEDMNPDLMDGIAAPRDRWAQNNLTKALRAESIVNRLDSSRIVYHHASGNFGPMHISNFYVNWVPVQEMSDWFGHWAKVGVKPMFTCEYGVPFTWDWAMYRGWYNGMREFGSAPAPWEFCNAEWNAQFVGDVAFQIGEPEKRNLRWEAKQFHDNKTWRRWDYPSPLGSRDFTDQDIVFEKYITDNWRAFRTWGLSINSFWEHGRLWSLKSGADRSRIEFTTDWENLQRPGFSPDFQDIRYERVDLAFKREEWKASIAAKALIRNNMPLLGYIGGKEEEFTGKNHNFLHGEAVEKQFVIINNSRETVNCRFSCSLHNENDSSLVNVFFKIKNVEKTEVFDKDLIFNNVVLKTGTIEQIPFSFTLPDNLSPGNYAIHVRFSFHSGSDPQLVKEIQTDSFTINVVQKPSPIETMKIALFDPKGETGKLLDALCVAYRMIQHVSELKRNDDIVIIGKDALDIENNGFDLTTVPYGLKVIVFEQTAQTLEKRLGFRTTEYGLRQVFKRIADHPLLSGISADNLHDWRGEATLLPSQLNYEKNGQVFNGVPTVQWCGITVPRVWRCGNRGNVASVLIEKPVCGDFLPVLDGGFNLQYSPLMEYRHGQGMILFCQMDVTGRTENDPAAILLICNMLRYVKDWKAEPRTNVAYVGDKTAENILSKIGVTLVDPAKSKGSLLLITTGNMNKEVIAAINKAKKTLAVGLTQEELNTLFPELTVKNGEHISTFFEPFDKSSPFSGIGPADLHNRDPKNFPLVSAKANTIAGGVIEKPTRNMPHQSELTIVGNGIIAVKDKGNSVICGLAPWQFPADQQSFKRTFRRSAFTLSRLLSNMNADIRTPLINRFHGVVDKDEQRWLNGLYLDQPEEWDDPYRFFRW